MSPVSIDSKPVETEVNANSAFELAPTEDAHRLSEASFSGALMNEPNTQLQSEGASTKVNFGFINKFISGCRDFVTGSLEAVSIWSSTIAEGVGKVFLKLTDYASQSVSKAAQNIATPETNRVVAETVETVTPAIGYGVGKSVGSAVSGLAAGLRGLINRA